MILGSSSLLQSHSLVRRSIGARLILQLSINFLVSDIGSATFNWFRTIHSFLNLIIVEILFSAIANQYHQCLFLVLMPMNLTINFFLTQNYKMAHQIVDSVWGAILWLFSTSLYIYIKDCVLATAQTNKQRNQVWQQKL